MCNKNLMYMDDSNKKTEHKMTDDKNKIAIAAQIIINIIKNIYKEKDSPSNNNDYFLIKNNVHEQAISYKIAKAFEQKFKDKFPNEDLSIDVEYNRNFSYKKSDNKNLINSQNSTYNKIKKIVRKKLEKKLKNEPSEEYINKYIREKTIRPDIILHERKNNKHNLFVVEIKKSTKDVSFDKLKLQILTNKLSYDYKLGLSLVLTKAEPKFTFYVQEDYYEIYKSKIKDSCEPEQIDTFVVVNDQGNIKYLDKEEYEKYSQKMLNYNTKQNNISIGTNNNTQE